jgi:hypothetical protein
MEIEALEKNYPAGMSEQAGILATRVIGLIRADGIAARMDELKVDFEGTATLTISVRADDIAGYICK